MNTLAADPILSGLTSDERRVLFGVTLAQVEDIHVLAWSMSDDQLDMAASLLERFAASEQSPLVEALVATLVVVTDDVDHPDFDDERWTALEALHRELCVEFGHTPAGVTS